MRVFAFFKFGVNDTIGFHDYLLLSLPLHQFTGQDDLFRFATFAGDEVMVGIDDVELFDEGFVDAVLYVVFDDAVGYVDSSHHLRQPITCPDLHLFEDGLEVFRKKAPDASGDGGGDLLVEGFGDAARDAGEGVAVAAQVPNKMSMVKS